MPTDTTAGPLAVPRRIMFAGDWHMNPGWAVNAAVHAHEQGADVIIHAGDFGYTFRPKFLLALGTVLEDLGIKLLFVDGNHDDHHYLAQIPVDDNGLRPIYTPHIWHLPRGFRWTWDGITFLALGGAHSVDRQWRLHSGAMWHPEERITAGQATEAAAAGHADIMITHDCPARIIIPGIDDRIGPPPFPPSEIRTSDQHRDRIGGVADIVQPHLLIHGHYHTPYVQVLKSKDWTMTVIGLDMDGTSIQTNTLTVDLEQLRPAAAAALADAATARFQERESGR